MIKSRLIECPECRGCGYIPVYDEDSIIDYERCPVCKGDGIVEDEEDIEFIPEEQ